MKKLLFMTFAGMALAFSLRADIIYPDGHVPKEEKEPFQLKKISSGVANLLTFPLEIPKAIFDTAFQEGIMNPQSLTLGVPRGMDKAFRRLSNGMYDLVTFGEDNEPLNHIEPEYFNPMDAFPGYKIQFDNWVNWETTDSPAFHMDTPDTPSWHH